MSTETSLREWRYGSTQAERLAAAVLRIEKYRNIEPQAPLGGGDDGADILCDRGGRLWVGAVYFPTTTKEFRDIAAKFKGDLKRALSHKRNGIVFVTNQRLTRGERNKLVKLALEQRQECIVYDVERLLGVLDSPEGYGVRVGYLRIPMTGEEQIAYFASRENALEEVLEKNASHMQSLSVQVANLKEGQMHVAHSVDLIAKAHEIEVEPRRAFDPLATGEIVNASGGASVVADLTPGMILFTHRLVCFELPPRIIGRFRTEQIYIQKGAAAQAEPTISPPPPGDVPGLVAKLCKRWRDRYGALDSDNDKLDAIAEFFHGLLFVHPFSDGNGRVARSLLMQQCLELFGHVDMSLFSRGVEYYEALQSADEGSLEALKQLVHRAVSD